MDMCLKGALGWFYVTLPCSAASEIHREGDSEQRRAVHRAGGVHGETTGRAGRAAPAEAGRSRGQSRGAAPPAGPGARRAAGEERRAAAAGAGPEPSAPPAGEAAEVHTNSASTI